MKDPTAPVVTVPIAFRKRGGRKQIVVPTVAEHASASVPARTAQPDSTLVRLLAKAHRWKRMFETGEYGSLAELAATERVNPSYLSRVLRLSLLAPEVVEAILDRQQPDELTRESLLDGFDAKWEAQTRWLA